MIVCIVMEQVGTTVYSVTMEQTTVCYVWMVLVIHAMELVEKPARFVMELELDLMEIVSGVMEQVGTTVIVVEEQVNAITVTDRDGKHAPIAMVKEEKHVLSVVGMAYWHAHIAMDEDGIHVPSVMEKEDECRLVFCSYQEESWL